MTSAVFHLPDPDTRPDFYEGVVMKRTLAWLIDMAIAIVFAVLVLPFTFFLAVFVFPMLVLGTSFIYRWFTLTTSGATWGMRLMAIELRDKDGGKPDPQTAFFHAFGTSDVLAMFPLHLISIAMILLGERRQSLIDNLLGTAMLNRAYTRY